MQTIKHNGKDVPVVEADVKVTIIRMPQLSLSFFKTS